MKKIIWVFLRNVFETITLHNFRKMDSFSQDHDLKLFKDMGILFIAAIYNTFHPLRVAFHERYTAYKTALASSQAATQHIETMWAELSSTKLEDWDVGIRNVYRKDTDRYKELFPNGHKPFHHGRYEERMTYIESLSDSIGADAALATVKADIDAFIAAYNAAFADQVGKQLAIRECADQLRVSRSDCAVAMFANLGTLTSHYAATPEVVGNYYDLEQIRSSTPPAEGGTNKELTLMIPAGSAIEGGFPFADEDVFLFYDSGMTKLAVNTSAGSMQPSPPPDALILQPEEDAEKAANVLGAPGNRFLIITNLDPLNDGEITISIVE